MAKKKDTVSDLATLHKLIRKLIIVQLGLAGTPQTSIRTIVGGDINEINAVVKLLPKQKS